MHVTSSPCMAICQIDPGTGFCIGCGRTGREIGDWVAMTEEERLAVMARLPARFDKIAGLAEARRRYEAMLAARGRTGRRRRV